jgi:predicted Mrr-cat superfamily restriction endonuclease
MSETRVGAFVLRISPSGVDRLPEALRESDIIIGWSEAEGLEDPSLNWTQFRQIIHDTYYSEYDNFRSSGRAAGEMWRFIREMEIGSLVVVPSGSSFYVAEVTGEFRREKEKLSEDSVHRRKVSWLNQGNPIPRNQAPSDLYSRMKVQGTSAYATDLLPEIRAVLRRQEAGEDVTFESDLHQRLIGETVDRLRKGFLNEREFERIIALTLERMGAHPVRVINARQYDQGADVVATFKIGRISEVVLAVQAKFYKPDPPVSPEWLDQLHSGMLAEGADLGWLVSTGTFSEDVEKRRDELQEKNGVRIDLIGAEELATMILQNGVSPSPAT